MVPEMPNIPGVVVGGDALHQLRTHVAKLMNFGGRGFPGAQPISFASQHLKELENENFFVSEKADGIRCLMYTTTNYEGRGETYLIDRKNSYYRLDLGLPIPGRARQYHFDTILDGELVLDVFDNGKKILWFLLFDCVVIDGKSLIDRPYTKRLGYLKEHILKPYQELLKTDRDYAQKQPFRMDLKQLQLSYHLQKVFEDIPHLKHKSDGIIFTSSVAPYSLGTCDKMLKWKPAEENTVDFKIRVDGPREKPRYFICLWQGGDAYADYAELTLDAEERRRWFSRPPDGAIIECRYDPEWQGRWRFVRFRNDKRDANHMNTYLKIMESIKDGVDKDTVCGRLEQDMREPMNAWYL